MVRKIEFAFFLRKPQKNPSKKDIFDFLKVQSIFLRFLLAFRDQKEVHFYATFEPFFSMDVPDAIFEKALEHLRYNIYDRCCS